MLVSASLVSCAARPAKRERLRVFLIGDSTMAHTTGYGDAFCARFDAATQCENLARGGRSSKSYRNEGWWDAALVRVREPRYRTYVLIQFGHNDQPGKAGRSTTLDEFKANLRRYVDEVRAAGAVPVLVTPLTRRSFRDGRLVDDLEPWALASGAVARESDCSLLDLHGDSMKAVAAMGPVQALALAELPPPDGAVAAAATGTTIDTKKPPPAPDGGHVPAFDYTHLGPKGAAMFSAIVEQEIRDSVPELAAHLR